MTFRILVTEPTLAPAGITVLREARCDVTFISAPDRAAEQVRILKSEPIDGIIARGIAVPGDVIRSSRTLKVISRHGVGYNHVDVSAATERGAAVIITTGANAQSVSELAIGL